MADDLDAQLDALEEAAPLTAEPAAEVVQAPEGDEAKPVEGDKPQEPEWTPPNREAYENVQKALRAEREQRRQAAQKAALMEQNFARMQERIEAWQAQQMAARFQQPPPDPFERPEEARAWQQQQVEFQQRLFQAEQQRQAQLRAEQEQAQHFQHINSAVEDYESEFKAQNPDYDDAAEHVLTVQQKILEGMGYPPDVAAQQVAAWSVSVAAQAIQTGRNPAQVVYELSRQMGWQPKNTGVEAAAQKLAAMRAGQDSAKTLSGGGAVKSGAPSLKQLAALEGAAFDSAVDKWLSDQIKGR